MIIISNKSKQQLDQIASIQSHHEEMKEEIANSIDSSISSEQPAKVKNSNVSCSSDDEF